MRVLVDTSVWSLALRRKGGGETAQHLAGLIEASLVVLIGPVRQEILSGISDADTFNRLNAHLEAFEDLPITTQDYVMGAQFYNTCRKHGIQGSHTDFLICAVAHRNNLNVFTTDKDFDNYARHLPVRVYNAR